MKKHIVKMIMFILISTVLVSCGKDEPIVDPVMYTVTFDTQGGSAIEKQTVESGKAATKPSPDPTLTDFTFEYWYLDDSSKAYPFNTPVLADITLKAKWKANGVIPPVKTDLEKLEEDIEAVKEALIVNAYTLNLPTKGPIHNSTIRWSTPSKYISTTGVVLPVLANEDIPEAFIRGRFTLNSEVLQEEFDVVLTKSLDVVIEDEKEVNFKNLTTEYTVSDKKVTLLFEKDGSVPYIKVADYFAMITGFIDPAYTLEFEKTGDVLEVRYDYYDEEDQHTYHLVLYIDAVENTMTTPDSGFYWAYVYSTATNYGRHINYDRELGYSEGSDSDVVYDLDDYNMDIVVYDNDIVIPYYIANQLFAGSSYYNVYYNGDGLYGIYSLPSVDDGDGVYQTIHTSSKNETMIPADLLIHNFNFLAFSMDYFYGLQELMNVETYYDYLFSIKNNLLSGSAAKVDQAIGDFLVKTIDEPHTSYGYPGYYNKSTSEGPDYSSPQMYGERFRTWYQSGFSAVDKVIKAKWNVPSTHSGWAATHPNRPLIWFIDEVKTSAVLSLDGFSTADIIEDSAWNQETITTILDLDVSSLLPQVTSASRYFYYNMSTQEQKVLEILIKDRTSAELTAYQDALINQGFVKKGLNYEKTVGQIKYYVRASFDQDYHALLISVSYSDLSNALEPVFGASPFDMIKKDSAVYMELQMERIVELSPEVSNIVLDLSWNTGGNVGALYRVVGFITGDRFAVSSIDGGTGNRGTSYIYIDGITHYDNLNWALLITPTTFSAANSLATIFQDNQLGPIIGVRSGGGASSITPILLPNGTAFTMSSNSMSAYRTGSGTESDPYVYTPNEFGIVPTHPIATKDIYNNDILMAILSGTE